MPDGKPLRERKQQHKRLLSVWCPPALKRDVKRIAAFERRPISRICAGLLRLGIGRYFELADAKMIAPLRAAMRDVFDEEQWIPIQSPGHELARAFDFAMEEGRRHFEAARS